MLAAELRTREDKLKKEQAARAEKARRTLEKERLIQERVAQRNAALDEERRQHRLAELAAQEEERLKHEEELEQNNGVWFQAKLTASPADEEAADRKGIKRGANKVSLPPSVGNLLTAQDAAKNGAMLFHIASDSGQSTHAGLLNFTAREGTAVLPRQVYRQLWDNPEQISGSPVTVTYKRLEKGSYVRLQPATADFQKQVGEDVRQVLETALLRHSALSEGDWITAEHAGTTYDLRVQKLKPASAVSVIDTDLEADVEPSLETERRLAEEEAAARKQQAELAAAEAEKARREAEQAAAHERAAAAAERLRQEKAASLPPEPDAGEPSATCVVRLPDGRRGQRRFQPDQALSVLFDYVDSLGPAGQPPGSYCLVTTYPRHLIAPGSSATLVDAGLTGQQALLLEPKS